MTTIELRTLINANINTCFNLARNVEAHLASTGDTGEKVVAGKTSGLFEEGDIVTWEARHFGIKQKLTVAITKMQAPSFFEDQMVKGAFKHMRHEHHFESKEGVTIMTDHFEFTSPLGLLGQLFDYLILKHYMTRFLVQRNAVLKRMAEKNNTRDEKETLV